MRTSASPQERPVPQPDRRRRRDRIQRLLSALYREDLRTGMYRVLWRRAGEGPLGNLYGTALRVQDRMTGLLEGHLASRGGGPPARGSVLRRAMRATGALLGQALALRGTTAQLQRFRLEERRASDRYGNEVDWIGWSHSERDTLDGHRCDLAYQDRWAEQLLRDRAVRFHDPEQDS